MGTVTARRVVNLTGEPTPDWVLGDGKHVNSLLRIWKAAVMERFQFYEYAVPKDAAFGFSITDIGLASFDWYRDGNFFAICAATLSKPGTGGTVSFRKHWRLDRDGAKVKQVANDAFLDWVNHSPRNRSKAS